MTPTIENRSGINLILRRARVYNLEIGNYQKHFINENFNYTVKLSNGRIIVPRTMAQDQERMSSSITEERIQNVAKGFIKDNP